MTRYRLNYRQRCGGGLNAARASRLPLPYAGAGGGAMITVSLHLDQRQLDTINARFGNLSGVLRQPMAASLETLRSYMADTYPPPFAGKAHFVSERQRRYVMAAIRRGTIQVPYVRTGKLGQSWEYQITVTGNGLRGEVGPGVNYARWVQSSESQARIHRGRWRTDLDAVNANRGAIVRHFRAAIQRALAG